MRLITVIGLCVTLCNALCQPLAGAGSCSDNVDIRNKNFQRLSSLGMLDPDLESAFVWVDDIDSRFFFGGYDSFDVYILIGKIYPPFGRDKGDLNRSAFFTVSNPKDANNQRLGPFTVRSGWKRANGAFRLVRDFQVATSHFVLWVQDIKLDRTGDNDRVTLQVCKLPVQASPPKAAPPAE